MKTRTYMVADIKIFVLGYDNLIDSLDVYTNFHNKTDNTVSLEIFAERIISMQGEGCYYTTSKRGKSVIKRFNKQLENNGCLINPDIYFAACFITKPEEMQKALGMSDEEAESMIRDARRVFQRYL